MKIKTITEKYMPTILNEALRLDVQNDVDRVYNEFFKATLHALYAEDYYEAKQLLRTRRIPGRTMLRYLKTPTMRQAMEMNPVDFIINGESNYYRPMENEISLALSPGGLKVLFGMGSRAATEVAVGTSRERWLRDLNAVKMKGSIHHEFAHYLDDTFNNLNLRKKMTTVMNSRNNAEVRRRVLHQGYEDVNVSDMEIEGIIHNVVQIHRAYRSRWDKITFDEMLRLEPSLQHATHGMSAREAQIWRRKIMERMGREGLLGKKMR